jgi:vacuolar-type H+-ATPase subunit F/Vma7
MHMFERFKFEFVVWFDLIWIEKIKLKENEYKIKKKKEKTKAAQTSLSLGQPAH